MIAESTTRGSARVVERCRTEHGLNGSDSRLPKVVLFHHFFKLNFYPKKIAVDDCDAAFDSETKHECAVSIGLRPVTVVSAIRHAHSLLFSMALERACDEAQNTCSLKPTALSLYGVRGLCFVYRGLVLGRHSVPRLSRL